MGASLLSAILAKHGNHDQLTHGNRNGKHVHAGEILEDRPGFKVTAIADTPLEDEDFPDLKELAELHGADLTGAEQAQQDRILEAVVRRARKPKEFVTDPDLPNLKIGKPTSFDRVRPMSGSEAQHRRIRAESRKRSLTPDSKVTFSHQGRRVHGRVKSIRGDGTIVLDLEDDRGTLTIPPHSSKELVVKHADHDQQDHDPTKGKGKLSRREQAVRDALARRERRDKRTRVRGNIRRGAIRSTEDSMIDAIREGTANRKWLAELLRSRGSLDADLVRAVYRGQVSFDDEGELIYKHTPGGEDHEQKNHGRRGGGSAESSPSTSSPGEEATAAAASSSPGERPSAPASPADTPNTPASESPLTNAMSPRGIPAPPGEPADVIRQTIEEGFAKHGARLQFIQENAGLQQMSDPGKRRGVDTMGEFGEWDGNNFIGWGDRAEIHPEILNAAARKQVEANDGRLPAQDRQAIVMAGLPGAGKTFILQNQLSDQFDLRDYAVVNADDIKEIIFEHGDVTDPTGGELDPAELSSMVHEESSWLAKRWRKELMSNGTNIALDITAANREKTLRDIATLQDNGYTVHVIHADVEVDEAVASALKRAGDSSKTPGRLGRVVPPDFIRSMHNESAGTDNISMAFADYAEAANGGVHWFRNHPLTRRPPVKVWSRPPIPTQQTLPTIPTEAPAA